MTTTNDIDARTIAADIMCGNARSITPAEVWAHIGQAYDTAEVDASIADEVAGLIAKTGIDLIWPDGTTNTELDAARVDIERLTAEVDLLRMQVYAHKPVIDAALTWAEMCEDGGLAPDDCRQAEDALHDAVESYRLMDMALTSAREEQAGVAS